MKNENGKQMRDYGLMESKATHLLWVNFDRHPVIGGKILKAEMSTVQDYLRVTSETTAAARFGSVSHNSESQTGFGYPTYPKDIKAEVVGDVPQEYLGGQPFGRECGGKAEEVAFEWTQKVYGNARRANLNEQNQGIDIVIIDRNRSFEVKSRDKQHSRYDKIFLQTGERNPDRKK